MSEYLAHLAKLHAYWINLDVSTERAVRWTGDNDSIFHGTTRVPAVHYEDVTDDELNDFLRAWRRVVRDDVPSINQHNTFVLRRSVPPVNFRDHARRTELAVLRSHIRALQVGLADEHERFVVSEDDATPRHSLWQELVPSPPVDRDIIIHGGGLPMAAHRYDDVSYISGKTHAWEPVTNPFNSLCATLYEVTRLGAMTILAAVHDHPMAFDQAWGFALADARNAVLRPTGFSQVGRSIRNGNVRYPAVGSR